MDISPRKQLYQITGGELTESSGEMISTELLFWQQTRQW